jgi:hypothetical protein
LPVGVILTKNGIAVEASKSFAMCFDLGHSQECLCY